jgi:hypothetical protein
VRILYARNLSVGSLPETQGQGMDSCLMNLHPDEVTKALASLLG